MIVATFAERPDLAARVGEITLVWPEFMLQDATVGRYWGRLTTEFPEFQVVLYDDEADRLLGSGRSIPFRWQGQPGGVDDVLVRGFEDGAAPTTLSALEAVLDPTVQGRGLSSLLIDGMRRAARGHGLDALVAPVRPTLKSRYPLTPMERYIDWRRDDGLPFDPWLRVHERLGAELLGVCPQSMLIEGTVAEWEAWTLMPFPESGEYVVEGGLVPVAIDRNEDLGRYVEPNVWVRHAV